MPRPRRTSHRQVEPAPGYRYADLGAGEIPYLECHLPDDGETHPFLLGFYDPSRGWGDLIPEALRTFEPSQSEHYRMKPAAAAQFRIERHFVECESAARRAGEESGHRHPLSRWCWCVTCGALCEDGRVARGDLLEGDVVLEARDSRGRLSMWALEDLGVQALAGGVRNWCDSCVRLSRRSSPAMTRCTAPGCGRHFAPSRGNQITCSNACRKALGENRRWHELAQQIDEFTPQGREQRAAESAARMKGAPARLPCMRGDIQHCMCETCQLDRIRSDRWATLPALLVDLRQAIAAYEREPSAQSSSALRVRDLLIESRERFDSKEQWLEWLRDAVELAGPRDEVTVRQTEYHAGRFVRLASS